LKKFILFLFVFGISLPELFAQTGVDSPYSRFGIGNLETRAPNARLQAMGGIGNAIGAPRFVNPVNPASYDRFDSLSFLFNVGFNASAVTYVTTKQTENGNGVGINYFSAGFPVLKWWRMAVGLLPTSNIAYNVVVPGVSPQGIAVNKSYEGSGGLNTLYFGNSFRLANQFSVGVNLNYNFGRTITSSFLYFPDSVNMATTKVENTSLINDISFNYGLLYTAPINSNNFLHFGLTYSQQMKLGATREYLIKSQFGGLQGNVATVVDTILYRPKENGVLVMPQKAGIGLAYEKKEKLLIGFDFNWQNWEKFEFFNQRDSLNNSWNMAAGAQYIPNYSSISGYWKRVTYRAGARYGQTYLKINGEPINEFGISFGIGLPLPRSLTTVDLSLEAGRRGTTAKNLIRESFVNFTVGVSIYERWFVKTKYN